MGYAIVRIQKTFDVATRKWTEQITDIVGQSKFKTDGEDRVNELNLSINDDIARFNTLAMSPVADRTKDEEKWMNDYQVHKLENTIRYELRKIGFFPRS